MKSKLFRLFSIILLIGVLCVGATPAHAAKIRVVTTLTDLADFARAVGGDLVEVHSLATGVEDTHGVPMKPSFVPMMNRADLLILVGFDCEHAFLPALLEASKNPRIQVGTARLRGLLARASSRAMCPSQPITPQGDVHPYGNPHYMLDPVLAKTAIAEHLQRAGRLRPAASRRNSRATAMRISPSSTPRLPSGRRKPNRSRA